LGIATPNAFVQATATTQSIKKYQATITTKDSRNNTKTFTDYCEASGNLAATELFKQRYPNGSVSGVREVK
jgi:hypothetical protein